MGAHPRSRGENRSAAALACFETGSSPLTRGKRERTSCAHTPTGLIPAHAGKTPSRARPRRRSVGSSPLTRGKHMHAAHRGPRSGLIPAHAGKTGRRLRHRRQCRAHPRSRGENLHCVQAGSARLGSSPLTRGKPEQQATVGVLQGLIPAHAGKTSGSSPPPGCRRAHPRSRGENAHPVAPCKR